MGKGEYTDKYSSKANSWKRVEKTNLFEIIAFWF